MDGHTTVPVAYEWGDMGVCVCVCVRVSACTHSICRQELETNLKSVQENKRSAPYKRLTFGDCVCPFSRNKPNTLYIPGILAAHV